MKVLRARASFLFGTSARKRSDSSGEKVEEFLDTSDQALSDFVMGISSTRNYAGFNPESGSSGRYSKLFIA